MDFKDIKTLKDYTNKKYHNQIDENYKERIELLNYWETNKN